MAKAIFEDEDEPLLLDLANTAQWTHIPLATLRRWLSTGWIVPAQADPLLLDVDQVLKCRDDAAKRRTANLPTNSPK